MVVRVNVKIVNEDKNRECIVTVLVNSGAESEDPVIVIDSEIAKRLEIDFNDLELIEVELASGKTHNYISRKKYRLELIDEYGHTLSHTYAYIAIDDELSEPLITDVTIDELGIQIIRFKEGLWRHVNDPIDKVRKSVERK